MRSRLLVTLFATGVLPLTATGGPPEPVTAVRLSVQADREAYLPHEPILLSWRLSNNSPGDLILADTSPGALFKFDCTDDRGRKVQSRLDNLSSLCLTTPSPTKFPQGGVVTGVADMMDYPDPGAADRLTLGVVYDSSTFGRYKGIWSARTNRAKVEFTIKQPEGGDAETAKFLAEAMKKNVANLTPWTDSGLCRQVLKESKSGRYRAVAQYYLGRLILAELDGPKTNEKVQEAVDTLEACAKNEAASSTLRELAKEQLKTAAQEAVKKPKRGRTKDDQE